MDEVLKRFREEHDCKYCLYFRKGCRARDRCVFDILPYDSLETEIELFMLS